jgi:hypothetical protein
MSDLSDASTKSDASVARLDRLGLTTDSIQASFNLFGAPGAFIAVVEQSRRPELSGPRPAARRAQAGGARCMDELSG